jgi:GT2 family glycosyltransferase
MAQTISSRPRVTVDGKFFRQGAEKFFIKGVTYAPFAPNAQGEPFAAPEKTASDFALARALGVNLLRIYDVPPRWFLDLAAQNDLLLLVDVPWFSPHCPINPAAARKAVRHAVTQCGAHPAVFAFSVVNEITPEAAQKFGVSATVHLIEELIAEAKRIQPDCLFTFANYPPADFLQPRNVDFACFNVYLHDRASFQKYLAHAQLLAGDKPLLLGETGIDSLREGEPRKCEILSWQIEDSFRGGLAGVIVFSFTDDWFKDGRQVEDWTLGLTTRERQPKDSFYAVQKMFRAAPRFPLPRTPKVSVVVASYNGERTLESCLTSLAKLNYPDYEIILVDDGSTDATPQTIARHPRVRCVRHEKNLGLSAARNTGIAAATGEIVAFTDSDCRADEDWLHFLIGELLNGGFSGVGGPNLLPPEDCPVAAAVMASPGGPAPVMLGDREAEHIPGCNMAFTKSALQQIGGFDPIFTKAGDDVDLCWRLQRAGLKIGFSPTAVVWHHRRETPGAYLRQQRGYGQAEAMLARKHPQHFNRFGNAIWRGKIYSPVKRGFWAQTIYSPAAPRNWMFFTTLEYHAFVTLPLMLLSLWFAPLAWLAVASLLFSVGLCVMAGVRADIPPDKRRWWSHPLVALLFLLQPLVRRMANWF